MGLTSSPTKSSMATDAFIEGQRQLLGLGQSDSRGDIHRSVGTMDARVTVFNASMTRMTGFALISRGGEDTKRLFGYEGDPKLIDRRFGGHAKRPREKGSDEECPNKPDAEQAQQPMAVDVNLPREAEQDDIHGAPVCGPQVPSKHDHTKIKPTQTPKRTRITNVLGLTDKVPLTAGDKVGPSGNTRSKASGSSRGKGNQRPTLALTHSRRDSCDNGGSRPLAQSKGRRWKGKNRAEGESDNIAEITAGIDGFSVFSNHQVEAALPPEGAAHLVGPCVKLAGGIDAGEWAQSITHSAKVEETAEAGSQVPVDAPKSCCPSTIRGLP
ncbi:hypothetical protein O181_038166 [Austropuccinia psidii MF-1]|uniref:Uncharacterized protein n=1 Tax=Austropuccinia psidii MF-1 TaxID=1389203 RepID=A0A9Q3D7I5_9BASI|nr:hypothetical protein [Austropuccinia psidii MF-1]